LARRRERPLGASFALGGAGRYEPCGAGAKSRLVAIDRNFENRAARPIERAGGAAISERRQRWPREISLVGRLRGGRPCSDKKQSANAKRRSQTRSVEPLHRVLDNRLLRGDRADWVEPLRDPIRRDRLVKGNKMIMVNKALMG